MRLVVLVGFALAGCNQVLGLDPPSGRTGDAAIDGPPGTIDAIDALVCTGTTTCFRPGQSPITGTRCTTDPVAACGDNRFRYCECGTEPILTRGVFLVPNLDSPEHSDLILVGEPILHDLEVLFDGNCFGPAAPACLFDPVACGAGGRAMYIWRDLPRGPGTYNAHVFVDDIGAPCTTSDGGTVLLDVSVTR